MSELLKIGVKADNGNAKAIHSDNNGNVQTGKVWGIDEFKLIDALEIRDTAFHKSFEGAGAIGAIDCSKYGLISLRVNNTTDQVINMRLCDDTLTGTSYPMLDVNGNTTIIPIPAGTSYWMVITSNDLPVLNYLKYLKVSVYAKGTTAPITGSVSVYAYGKR